MSPKKNTQIEEHAVALAEHAAMLLIAAEQLGIKTQAVENSPLDEPSRMIVANLPTLDAEIKKKLAKKEARFTLAEVASMVMTIADRFLDADAKETASLLFVAKELMDCLQESISMSQTSPAPNWSN